LHDKEVGVVDVELYGLEEVLNGLLLGAMAVDEVFGGAPEHDLPGYAYCGIFFEPDGRLLLVPVIEYYCNAGLGDSGLSTFVDEILRVTVSKGPAI
jgi:hypothetical protein